MKQRWPYLVSLLTALLLLAAVAIVQGLGLASRHAMRVEEATARMERSTVLIAEWLRSSVAVNDAVLRDIVYAVDPSELHDPTLNPVRYDATNERLLDKMATVPGAFLVGLFDETCHVTHGNAILGFDASDRDYCQDHLNDPTLERTVSNVLFSNTGALNVTQTRAIRRDDGSFAGFAALGIDLATFDEVLARIAAPEGAIKVILDENFTILARTPTRPDSLGQTLQDAELTHMARTPGALVTRRHDSPVDGIERLITVHRLDDLPFIIVVGEPSEVYLSGFGMQMASVVAYYLLLAVLVGFTIRGHYNVLRHRDELDALAHVDALTKVANRRAFATDVEAELARMHRNEQPFSLLTLDIDRFKAVNDAHGHHTGDRLLEATAAALVEAVREVDVVARTGGDEFAVLLPETNEAGARRVVARILEHVATIRIATPSGTTLTPQVSIGAATATPGDDVTMDALMRRADDAMYAVKMSHRTLHGLPKET